MAGLKSTRVHSARSQTSPRRPPAPKLPRSEARRKAASAATPDAPMAAARLLAQIEAARKTALEAIRQLSAIQPIQETLDEDDELQEQLHGQLVEAREWLESAVDYMTADPSWTNCPLMMLSAP